MTDRNRFIPDLEAAIRMSLDGVTDKAPADIARGSILDLMILKQKNRGLKTLLSIGGWTFAHENKVFDVPAHSAEGRAEFAISTVELVKDLGFDGIDIDWEYPQNEEQAKDFVLLLKEVRVALDAYAEKSALGYHFLITIACPAGATEYGIMHLKEMDQYLDSWHLMGYDYSGAWSPVTSHGSNVYKDKVHADNTQYSTHDAVQAYIAAGVPAQKIVMGMPLYGRTFQQTDGLGSKHGGVSDAADYRDLPKPGAVEHFDPDTVATYSYNEATRELTTYQGKDETRVKAEYLKTNELGGAMFWQAFQDKQGDDSLVHTVRKSMGSLEDSRNLLHYPESQYSNIKNVQPVQESVQQTESGQRQEHLNAAGSALAVIGHWLGLW
ncbi:uncharacterized protein LY89DRAFT_688281 [Mollisia scopiformis]|uniref:chitinase n=1 Tax=Mollisia scopiformis TaxID=149040 RepID=A0A194WXE9_MOLSC|nr:uncharacterized protein LY89DRAFT_688281 [Mollisia scopiformis]KUJ12658.1 hypothetical protein LY89DRAFT_688281 [Mollisia scopiformis]